jgi:tetratricopeptide (TPR) repeat protein
MVEGTSVIRYERAESLVQEAKGRMTPQMVAAILRDRHVPGVDSSAPGHQSAINGFIASHSVVIDATAGVIWVSQHPHQMGGYIPFSLDQFESPVGVDVIGPDPLLAEGVFKRYRKFTDLLAVADKLAQGGDYAASDKKFKEAIVLNPVLYLPYFMAGRVALEDQRFADAKEYLRQAQSLFPAYASERSGIKEMLDRIEQNEKTNR